MRRTVLVLAVFSVIILAGAYLGSHHGELPITAPRNGEQHQEHSAESIPQDNGPTNQYQQANSSRHSPADPGSYTRDLIASLTNIDTSTGRLTPEQASRIRQSFQGLVVQGTAAIPAIRTVLDQKTDLSFGKGSGDSIGAPSLRTCLMETLRQIGGPEAVEAAHQALQNTSDPLEIALLTRNLEEAAPGQYRQDALQANLSALSAAGQGQLTNSDVGPLFQALQAYGGSNSIAELMGLAPKYGYYASMALAGLPSGAGIPALTQMAQDTSESGTGNRQFALQMLAQASGRYSDAGAALVDLSRQNQVPDTAWSSIAAVLGGQQFQFTRDYPANMFATLDGSDLRTYRQPNGNQNFISTTAPSDAPGLDLNQRLALIDQLLATTSSPAAQQVLQQTRARLAGVGGPK